MEQDVLYYGNTGKGSVITRELIANLFGALSKNISSPSFCDFISKSRVPNERELYGIFVKSLIESCGEGLGYIATEFQVGRIEDSENENSKGRVDLLFDYRSVSYMIELKVGRINARGNDREPKIKAKKIWHEAISQLNNLIIDSVDDVLQKKSVKIPIALYFFDSKMLVNDEEIDCNKIHENILDFIKRDESEDETKEFTPDFNFYSKIPRLGTRLRKTPLNAEHNNHIYGFGFFAKQIT
jgi:hypothetical protein